MCVFPSRLASSLLGIINTVFVITTLHASFAQVAVGYNSASSQTTATTTKSGRVKPACFPPPKEFPFLSTQFRLVSSRYRRHSIRGMSQDKGPCFISISLRKNNVELCHHTSLLLSVIEGVKKYSVTVIMIIKSTIRSSNNTLY